MMGRWYRDSAVNDLNAALFLKAASAGADAVGKVAQIPGIIDERKFRDKKFALAEKELSAKEFIAKLNADTKLSVADKRAAWESYKASAGLEGKYVTAAAKDRATDASLTNNDRTTQANKYVQDSKYKVAKLKSTTQKEVAKLNKKAPAPKVIYDFDGEGNLIARKVTKPYEGDPLTIAQLQLKVDKARKSRRR